MATAHKIRPEVDVDIRRTMVNEIPEIKAKGICNYENDVPATVNELTTEATLSHNWAEIPDFILRVWLSPRTGTATFGTLTTMNEFGKLSAASWKELNSYNTVITFTAGTYGAIKKFTFPSLNLPYLVQVAGVKDGSSEVFNLMVPADSTPKVFDVRRLDYSSSVDLVINIYFYADTITLLTANALDSDSGNNTTLLITGPLNILVDAYNSIDKFEVPTMVTAVSQTTLEGTMNQVVNYGFLEEHAEALNLDKGTYIYYLVSSLHYADNKGWITLTDFVSDYKKLQRLSAKVVLYATRLTSGDPGILQTIPEHFITQLSMGSKTKSKIMLAALLGAIDEVIIDIEP